MDNTTKMALALLLGVLFALGFKVYVAVHSASEHRATQETSERP